MKRKIIDMVVQLDLFDQPVVHKPPEISPEESRRRQISQLTDLKLKYINHYESLWRTGKNLPHLDDPEFQHLVRIKFKVNREIHNQDLNFSHGVKSAAVIRHLEAIIAQVQLADDEGVIDALLAFKKQAKHYRKEMAPFSALMDHPTIKAMFKKYNVDPTPPKDKKD